MPGVPSELTEHSLHVDPAAKPVKQGLRRFNADRKNIIGEEIARLLAAGFIMEAYRPKWLANPVLVLKKNDEWRMCVDYTSLNKVYLKDPFALPRIEQIIDAIAGSELLCFLDAYSGYHQIKLKEEDQEKTLLITPFGAFCYKTMSFGLKNAEAKYQRCIQIGRNVHAYVDDFVIKSQKAGSLLDDIKETFTNLRKYR